ncbi:MAG: thiamine diphosphokinase [Actinomycetia bacterium]|nr:thiamine diphosphokinase [Actinomycetes bacterium]
MIIAVDEGIDRCMQADLAPAMAVGDFDSVSAVGLEWVKSSGLGVQIIPAPRDKDYSDLDLALRTCRDRGITQATLLGFVGGRIDHQLVVLGVCARYSTDMAIVIAHQTQTLTFVRAPHAIKIEKGHTFSVIALIEDAGISIEGARFPLHDHVLKPLSDLGLSNVADKTSTVTVHDGVALVIDHEQPNVEESSS